MDGPDGWCRYWCDFRRDEKHLCRRQTGGGGVMVWVAFSNFGQVGLIFYSLKMDQDQYIQALEENLWIITLNTMTQHGNFCMIMHPSIAVTELNYGFPFVFTRSKSN